MHDAYRVDKGGAPTFDRVMRGLSYLQKYGVEYNTLTTLHHANADHPVAVYRFLRDECRSQFMQFIPIIERINSSELIPLEAIQIESEPETHRSWQKRPLYTQSGDQVTGRSVTAEQYGLFLNGVFDEWVHHDVGEVFVQMFDVALANWYGEPPSLCVHSKTCGLALAMEHNGDMYSCDHFVEPGYLLGNIRQTPMSELVASAQQRKFGEDKFDKLPRYCLECDVRFACHGGCPKDRFIATPEGEPGLNYLCAGYKLFFHHVDRPMRIMSDLLRQNRAPAEIVTILATEEAAQKKARRSHHGRRKAGPTGE